MKLIASGRASEIFDLGDGRVLRRFRAGGDPEREALVMEQARAHGFPTPLVLEVAPESLVLERIEGRTMLEDLRRRPWKIRRRARQLAELHKRLCARSWPSSTGTSSSGLSLRPPSGESRTRTSPTTSAVPCAAS